MEDALNRHSLTVFGISAYLFAARLRYLRCNGACSPNVRVIADENSGILDLLSDPSLQSLRQYSPSYFSAFDFHGFLASSVPVVVRHIHKLLFSRVKYHRELITTQGKILDCCHFSDRLFQTAAPSPWTMLTLAL